jgi:membrane-associated phospholipid phosphatase
MEIIRAESRGESGSSGAAHSSLLLRWIRRGRTAFVAALDACGAFEWVALSYLGFSGLLMIGFSKNLSRAGRLLEIHAGVTAAIFALVVSARRSLNAQRGRRPLGRILRVVRDWYPQAVFLYCFEELGALEQLIHRGWRDSWMMGFDHWLTGVNPTVWLQQFVSPIFTDFMQMAYLSYFFFLTILGFVLYIWGADSARGDSPRRYAFWAVMTSSIAGYVIGYTISLFLTVESPHYFLAAAHLIPLDGGLFTRLSDLIEHYGRVHGGAFPSEHVVGSFVALLGAWRYRRRLFWIFLPFFACMCVSTVYVRNHYIADVLAGIVVGWIGFWAAHLLMRLPRACPEN